MNCINCGKDIGKNKNFCSLQCYIRSEFNPSKNPLRRKELSNSLKGRKLSERYKRKIGRTMKKRLQDPVLREKWRQVALNRNFSEEKKKEIVLKIILGHSRRPQKVSRWIQKVDEVFSKYIRNKYAKNGYVNCFTCGKLQSVLNIDCGHYISRRFHSTRYLEENAHPQCRYCNRYMHGVIDEYTLRLQEKYGEDILKKLNEKKKEIKQFSVIELQELYKIYQEKLSKLYMPLKSMKFSKEFKN